MKVTALMSPVIISEVKSFTKGKNITESLILALTDWLQIQKLKALSEQIECSPLTFQDNFSAKKVRELNRKS